MAKKIIAGNWKMNLNKEEANYFVEGLLTINDEIKDKNVILFPNFLLVNQLIEATVGSNIKIGAQNCANNLKGAYTGEISAMQIADMGCKYCLIGHWERRNLYGETDLIVNEKVNLCLQYKITPIVCIGEDANIRNKGTHIEFLKQQLAFVKDLDVIIAYEPIWAIGTGNTPTIKEILQITELVHSLNFKTCLYGGSVNPNNVSDILSVCDGVLVGGSSLKLDDFVKIIFA